MPQLIVPVMPLTLEMPATPYVMLAPPGRVSVRMVWVFANSRARPPLATWIVQVQLAPDSGDASADVVRLRRGQVRARHGDRGRHRRAGVVSTVASRGAGQAGAVVGEGRRRRARRLDRRLRAGDAAVRRAERDRQAEQHGDVRGDHRRGVGLVQEVRRQRARSIRKD